MTARRIVPLSMDFTAECARLTRLKLTAAQIAGTLKCKTARVEWALRKLRIEAEKGRCVPHRAHLSTPFHGQRTAAGDGIGDRWVCREPDGVTFPAFEDHPAAPVREAMWRPQVGVLP